MDEESAYHPEPAHSMELGSLQDEHSASSQALLASLGRMHSAPPRGWGVSDSQAPYNNPSGSCAISRSSSRSRDLGSEAKPEASSASPPRMSHGSFSAGGRRNRVHRRSWSDRLPDRLAARRWDPSAWVGLLVVVVGSVVSLLWFVCSNAIRTPEPDSCIKYSKRECLLATNRQSPFIAPRCTPRACAFNPKDLQCPFAASGTFRRVPKPQGVTECTNPFMEGGLRRLMPTCSKSCCDGEMAGSFAPGDSQLPGSQTWQPRRAPDTPYTRKHKPSCSFFQYSSAEVLHYLQSNQVRVLVMGDSFQKELHSRLVHMFRGSSRVIDYGLHTMARYSLCRRADNFSIPQGGYHSSLRGIQPEPTLERLPKFFGVQPSVDGCSEDDLPVVFDNIYSARFSWQLKHLKAYRAAMPRGEALILIIAVNVMEPGNEVPLDWLQYLDDVRNEIKVIVMSSPTGRLAHKEFTKVLQYRNKLLKSWVASIDAISFVDFEAMSRAATNLHARASDIHYMCSLLWPRHQGANSNTTALLAAKGPQLNVTAFPEPRPEENVLRERVYNVAATGIHTTDDGHCRDEMNLNLWQVIFNIFMKWEPN